MTLENSIVKLTKGNRRRQEYASGNNINLKINDLKKFLKNEDVNPLTINSNTQKW